MRSCPVFFSALCLLMFPVYSYSADLVPLNNGTVRDTRTNLIWLKNANCFGSLPLITSNSSAKTLATGQCDLTDGSVAGDWHYPTIGELESLTGGASVASLSAAGFYNVQQAYGSSSRYADMSGYYWHVDLSMPVASSYYHYSTTATGVWPVRSGLTNALTLTATTSNIFSDTNIGNASAPLTFTITNSGSLIDSTAPPIQISGISITGTNAADFGVTPGGPSPCPSLTPTMASGTSCTVNVTFYPTTTGIKSASLHVTSNATATPVLDANVSGTGTPHITDQVGLIPLNNGTVRDTRTNLIWLKNANCFGALPLTTSTSSASILASGQCGLTDGSVAGDWHYPTIDELESLTGGASVATLAAAGFYNVQQIYGSSSIYADLNNYYWHVDLSTSVASSYYHYYTSATGVWPVRSGFSNTLTLTPASNTFSDTNIGNASVPLTFTISNVGSIVDSTATPIQVSSISITGTNAADFGVTPGGPNPCASLTPTLASGTNCTVNVTFYPTVTGIKSATLHVISTATVTPVLDSTFSGSGTPHITDAVGFLPLNNGTVKDTRTNLIWLKNANCFGALPLTTSTSSANTLASGQCGLTDGSVAGDWHYPTIDELESLTGGASVATLAAAGFYNVKQIYGSSSIYADLNNYYWHVDLSTSVASSYYHYYTGGTYVWPVRSGSANTLTLTPVSNTFADTIIGNASVPLTFTISNVGSIIDSTATPIQVSGISITGTNAADFGVTPGGPHPCPSLTPTLASGTSCTVNVTFYPTATGVKSGSLHVISTATVTPALDSTFSGTGIQTYSLTVHFAGDGSGQIHSVPAKLACSSEASGCSGSFASNVNVSLIATPSWNSLFVGWSGDCNGINNCNPAMNGTKSVTATFSQNQLVQLLEPRLSYFSTLQNAYNNANTDSVIYAKTFTFFEDFVCDRQGTYYLYGGMDSGFQPSNGFTTITGSLVIKEGAVIIKNISIQ